MEIEDEMFLEDDGDILDVIRYGFPRRYYQRTDFFNDMDDISFFRRFRLQKNTVLRLLQEIEHQLEFDNNLNNSVSPINQLLTCLRFYASNAHQNCIGDFMNMHQTTASRIISKTTRAIASLARRYIKMPREANEIVRTQNMFDRIARFPRVIGCVDGTHIKIQSPGGQDGEIYRNRKSYFSINVQVVAGADLKLLDIVARWPGSTHDSTIFNASQLRARFEGGQFQNALLLGDSGYQMKNYLLTPLLNPVTAADNLFNESHIRTRNVVERLIGVWKRRFPILAYGSRCKLDTILSTIVATGVLQNIAVDMHEDLPPVPEELNGEDLDYLVLQGDIPHLPMANLVHGPLNYRQHLIDNYFAYL